MAISYHFISFNYTEALDKTVQIIFDTCNGILYSHNYNNGIANRTIDNNIRHVQGKLNERIIMGVNATEQLPFPKELPYGIKRKLIKPEKNTSIGYNTDAICAGIIQNSNIICIYGMSLGATDTIWWERIGEWLLTSNAKALIYFVYDENVNNDKVYSIDDILDTEDNYCDMLLNIIKILPDKRATVQDKIFVIVNSTFMQIHSAKKDNDNVDTNLLVDSKPVKNL